MMKRLLAVVICIGFNLISPAHADNRPTFSDLWNEATHKPNNEVKEFPDFTMVTCDGGLTYYYFTKQNHPAHPGVIIRKAVEKDGAWFVNEDGHSFASDAAQPAFKAWLAQFTELDRQMAAYLKSKSPGGGSN
jgi:hypothetical protein